MEGLANHLLRPDSDSSPVASLPIQATPRPPPGGPNRPIIPKKGKGSHASVNSGFFIDRKMPKNSPAAYKAKTRATKGVVSVERVEERGRGDSLLTQGVRKLVRASDKRHDR